MNKANEALDKKAENAREIGLDYTPAQTDWEAVAADQAMTIALMKAEQPAQQEPVAWMYDQAKYGPTDLRGQQWRPALSWSKPYTENGMVRELKPLYTSPQPAQQEPVAFDDADIYGFWARNKKAEQPAQPASEADMKVYKAIADNYHASLQPTQRKPLTDEVLRNVLRNTNDMIRNAMHGTFWPELEQACRAIEAAHGIKE